MKNILLIIIISIYTSSFSQAKIDTSEVKSIRYEWKIDVKNNDTILNQILTEYKSGIYKEEFVDYKKEHHEYPFINIFESKTEYLNRDLKNSLKVHYWSVSNAQNKFYYDKFGILDSVYLSYRKDSLKEITKIIKKEFDKNHKLKWLINQNGEKEVFSYNSSGIKSKIEVFKDTTLFEINNFEKGRLIEQVYPTRKKYRKKFTYKYDDQGRMTVRNDDDYFLWNYYYNDFGLIKKEKIYKKKNMIAEYYIYEYDIKGDLINQKRFGRNDRLMSEFKYEYK